MSARPRRADPSRPAVDVASRIEEVATRLFIEHGYNGVSYLDIAGELGTTHSRIHYYFRTKDVLAEAVLHRVSSASLEKMGGIWTNADTSLFEKFIETRNWIYGQYLQYNPGGKGGRPWGLLARFTLDSDSLTPAARRLIRDTLEKLDGFIGTGVRMAIERGELVADAPEDGLTLQISSLMSSTGQMTRRWSGFGRLHDLLRWTYVGIVLAYGRKPKRPPDWPALPVQPDDRSETSLGRDTVAGSGTAV